MTTTRTNPMTTLRQRLSAAGVKRKYLNACILPEWWDDEAALNPAGFSEAQLYVANRLGLTIDSLQSGGELRFTQVSAKFKKRSDTNEDDLRLAKMIAFRAARVAVLGCNTGPVPLPTAPGPLREEILKTGAKCVTLEGLLDYCWAHGIPVIHIGEFPPGTKKMDGLSARIDGRPAIVLSKNITSKSAMAFILAHELGHLALGHLPEDTDILLDQSWERNENDHEEQAANTFAAQVLTGMEDPRFTAERKLTGDELAAASRRFGEKNGIAPGVVALNYGWTRKFFPVAFAALKILEPNEHSVQIVRQRMVQNLTEELMPTEAYEWLLRLTEAPVQVQI
ncbi:MAG: hypothetical protein PWP23_2262 [Candidatus Sumerlaeota bacterium]|nr:hypothetical protein [Candidatus Sumerlaeota bacterium]